MVVDEKSFEEVVDDMMAMNPHITERAKLTMDAKFNKDGSLESWYLGYSQLRILPESFSSIRVGGGLYLEDSQLRSLPDSFGGISVGGDLSLQGNQLRSLPDSFGGISLKGYLNLSRNKLISLPDSFDGFSAGWGNVRVCTAAARGP